MVTLLAFNSWHYLYSIPLSLVSLFLILVILVQRGRGGGLTGALGGMGGQSAFGTKAGDLFTKITIVVAAIWILLSLLAIQRLARQGGRPATAASQPSAQDKDKDQAETGDDKTAPGAAPAKASGKAPGKVGSTAPAGKAPANASDKGAGQGDKK